MNLYGEHGNILALKKHLEAHKIKVTVTNLSLEDSIDFKKYDLFYMGSGNNESFHLALKNLLNYQKEIKEAHEQNKFFIVTGNALNLFGTSYTSKDNLTLKTLGLFEYEAYETDFRIVGEQMYQFKKLSQEIIGFQNRNSVLKLVKEPHLFDVLEGTGYVPKSIVEGITKKHFYGTYLLGPLLIRNPHFNEYLMKQICKELEVPYQEYKDVWEEKAYLEYRDYLLQEK